MAVYPYSRTESVKLCRTYGVVDEKLAHCSKIEIKIYCLYDDTYILYFLSEVFI